MKKFSLILFACLVFCAANYSQSGIPNETKYAENKTKGIAFLLANGAKEGVVTLPSGLQYKIIKKGSGAKPTLNNEIKVDYVGMLIDGTVFDSSIERGEPAVFPVNAVIPGWVEALQMMPVGSKWQLFIPQELAYGNRGQDPIPPYSTLIFEVELISIEK